ncbi:MAG: pyruvoyl-dependent arginine decarboxylase [Patescibacteria group bacterium]
MPDIQVKSGAGVGETDISAYDSALSKIGVHNFNLVLLSSVIPPHSIVRTLGESEIVSNVGSHGDRLYVVQARADSCVPGSTISSGIGWIQYGEDNRGLFVEHHSDSAESCRDLITASLSDMCVSRSIRLDPADINMEIIETKCRKKCTSAIVMAVFEHEPWC